MKLYKIDPSVFLYTNGVFIRYKVYHSHSHLIGRIPPKCGESDVIRGCPVGEECCPVGLMTNVCDPKLGWREGDPEPEGGVTMPFSTTD